ncbi:hypothetical protein TeGR_g3271 [Tetraparma gracilis]|uniref:Uncharacterized protein n=1 Tax=Tetraparma gracilis TaxID=2962635 RepID=A0ABQ6MVU4_9STRA|nr:hypothetical protein TeGR_g3271 [Tetraparma gracilis]
MLPSRQKHTPSCQSISYINTSPLTVLSASKSYIHSYTPSTVTVYLDTRNNVSSAGHGNPAIADAVHQQMLLQNSNSRYLHSSFNELKEQIAARLGGADDDGRGPWKIILTNAGSESNDVALRIARAHLQHKRSCKTFTTYTYSMSYHGHSTSCLSVSPYKLRKLGHHDSSLYCPPDTQVVWLPTPCPSSTPSPSTAFDAAYTPSPSTLMFECGMSVAGVVLPPASYLSSAVSKIRSDGGLAIYDEVQSCCYRTGEFTCFQTMGYPSPDIVTLGKPLGNGFPLSACCVRADVLESFENEGLEYFNTFGGNAAACAAGLATLSELDRLRPVSDTTGALLLGLLRDLHNKHPRMICDVRGRGMFLGVEFLNVRAPSDPSPEGTLELSFVASRLKDFHHVLTTIDGAKDSVMVIKPPLCFSPQDAAYFADCLDKAITECLRDVDENGAMGVLGCGATST